MILWFSNLSYLTYNCSNLIQAKEPTHVRSYHVRLYHVNSYLVMSDHVTSDHLMPGHIISDHIISDCIMSNHIWSNHVMAYNNKIPHRMQMCDVPVCTAAPENSPVDNLDKLRQKKCRYNNGGYCKYESKCRFIHPENCKNHLNDKKCEDNNCPFRHHKMCKWMKSKLGCTRSNCEYLHQDTVHTKILKSHWKVINALE